jgi:DNA recombination protein RmuC
LSVPDGIVAAMDIVVPLLLLLLGIAAGVLIGLRWARRDDRALAAIEARGEDQAVIRDGLQRLDERMRDLERQRVAWQGQLHQQVDDVRVTADQLRRETAALATALRRPQVRGRWGELHLRRTVELAGMVDHCDFAEQVHLVGEDGAQRPDLVVRLAGGRSIVVDSKVPLDAHLDALATDDEEERQAHLRRHARQLRAHVDGLSAKAYWRSLPCTPEFVVLFVPTESSLAAALDADPTLLEHAAAHNVVVATPTTLIALLRTVAHGWTTEALAESTREVHELGRDLHARLGVLGGHLDRLGRALKGSVEAYNRAVGSLESRVLVTARQFEDIGVTRQSLPSPGPVREVPRPLTAAELLDAVADERPELPPADPPVTQPPVTPGHRTG